MSDATIRLAITIGLLGLFVGLEHLVPARANVLDLRRFSRHVGMTLLSSAVARLALAGGLAGIATFARDQGVGLFNVLALPIWIAIGISFLVLDLSIWGQHLIMHKVPILWRLHRVHHSDIAMDVSTALRFHPAEILVSLAYKAAIVIGLGAPPVAVFVFEIVLGAGALFTHANITLPPWLERYLRILFVTPALHLIHHSPDPLETNSNYGFSFNIWDRVFGTYRGTRLEQDGPIGLENWRTNGDQKLMALLSNPIK